MTLDSSSSLSSLPLPNNYAPTNFRQQTNGMMNGGDVFGPYQIPTPSGIVHSQIAPAIPPRPNSMFQSPSTQMFSPYSNNFGYNNSFGNGYYGMGGGFNSFGGGYGNFGRPAFGNPLDPDMRFIQMAEERSRSAFQSIESVVMTIGNIATMLDSTYFALTSSFRAILGLAANFSHLRGFFARFFSTFAIFRSVMWIYRKFLYVLGLSKTNPSSSQINLNEAFSDAEKIQSNDFFNSAMAQNTNNSSGLAMVLFLTFVFSAPYLIMKLFGSLMNSNADQSKNPSTWTNPIDAVVLYNFNAEHPSELSVKSGQLIKIAPREIQEISRLLSTNWLLATADGKNVGLVPVNYIKRPENSQIQTTVNMNSHQNIVEESSPPQADLLNKNVTLKNNDLQEKVINNENVNDSNQVICD